VKICGITRKDDALVALLAGVHALGFVFYPGSPRCLVPEKARRLIYELPPLVSLVGVFVNTPSEEMVDVARYVGLDTLQLHGNEPPEACDYCRREGFRVIKAIRVREKRDLEIVESYRGVVSAFLLDTLVEGSYGGTGCAFPWALAREVGGVPVVLAGGLCPDNVKEAMDKVKPWAVDVSSGVEKEPGVKDHKLIKEFMERVLSWRVAT